MNSGGKPTWVKKYKGPPPQSSTSAEISPISHRSDEENIAIFTGGLMQSSRKTENAGKGNSFSPHLNSSSVADAASCRESSEVSSHGIKGGTSEKGINSEESSRERTDINERNPHSVIPYDICPLRSEPVIKLKPPLLVKNREARKESKRNIGGVDIKVLRPGMLLLKNYISLNDQVIVIKKCRELGRGPGGFYQPGYDDGANLNLKMMCLGLNWDPSTNKYGAERRTDGAKPPLIPEEFHDLVGRAMKECHKHLVNHCRDHNVEKVLPSMSPDVCIVNFYTQSGRLGLHQDKDESLESLRRQLPVVSLSIGDSAEFLYGDKRDAIEAAKITLESGDVLIFGGEARHIYHGVPSIIPNTAPQSLSGETNLRPGRLNLTFRQF